MTWELKRLDELGQISRGRSKHRPRNDPKLFGGDYPFIQTADVKSADYYITDYSETYNEDGLKQSKLWDKGTLCITIAANIADTAVLAFPACFPDSIMGFIPYEGVVNTRFLKACFDILQKNCQKISQGTAQDNLSWEKLSTIKFPIPAYAEQKKIADILSAYDDLIENHQRQIRLLEEAAQRLYKEWFVKLRFPGHETTNIIDGVPEGWIYRTLSEIANIVMGQSPKSEFYNMENKGLPFHQGVADYGMRFVENKTYTESWTRVAESGDILFSVRAPVGRLNITRNRIAIGRGLAAIRESKGRQHYLYYLLAQVFFKDNMIGNGSIFASITKETLHQEKFLIATDELIGNFDSIAKSIDEQIDNCDSKIKFLKEARDRLLPRLMRGELKV